MRAVAWLTYFLHILFYRCRHFTDEELAEIKSITLRDVILMSTDVKEGDLPDDVFFGNIS